MFRLRLESASYEYELAELNNGAGPNDIDDNKGASDALQAVSFVAFPDGARLPTAELVLFPLLILLSPYDSPMGLWMYV